MIVQILLTLCFLFLSFFCWLRMGRVRFFALVLTLVCLTGLYFVWFPENLTAVANWIGVGRGADLLLYIFLSFVLFEFLVIRIREKERMELFTRLVRRIAIDDAKNRLKDTKNN